MFAVQQWFTYLVKCINLGYVIFANCFRMPTLWHTLIDGIQGKRKPSSRKRIALVTVICKLCNIYNKHLNALAKINGLRLKRAGLTKQMITELNHTFDCISYQAINNLLDRYAELSSMRISKWEGENLRHCGDYVDIRIRARHELGGRSGLDLHMYNNLLYRSRINVENLPDQPPAVPSVEEVSLNQFIPNREEQNTMLKKLEPQVAKIWADVQELESSVESLAKDDHHAYMPQMKCKTEKVRF